MLDSPSDEGSQSHEFAVDTWPQKDLHKRNNWKEPEMIKVL